MKLRDKLILLRDKAGLSQMNLANKLGVSRQAVSRWETGDSIPTIDNLQLLAKIYDVSLDWLCNDSDEPAESEKVTYENRMHPKFQSFVYEKRTHQKSKYILLSLLFIVIISLTLGLCTHTISISLIVALIALIIALVYMVIRWVSNIVTYSKKQKEGDN